MRVVKEMGTNKKLVNYIIKDSGIQTLTLIGLCNLVALTLVGLRLLGIL